MSQIPTAIMGERKFDQRGSVAFVNDFDFKDVKRFYSVRNRDMIYVRAFHGHMKEAKYVYVVSGAVIFCAVKLTDTLKPDIRQPVERFVLTANKPKILYIPPGYANGFRALNMTHEVIFFSTATLAESLTDDFRFPADYWGTQIWEK